MSVQEAAALETETPANLTVIEGQLPAVNLYDEMIASIGRTMLLTNTVRIPLVSRAALEAGNQSVRDKFGEQARELTIVGPDAIVLDHEQVGLLPSIRSAELLGYLILERRVSRQYRYLEAGFFRDSSSENSRGVIICTTFPKLTGLVTSQGGKPLVTSVDTSHGREYGIDDLVVTDMRHTVAYRQARERLSVEPFKRFIFVGGPRPSMAEHGNVLGARRALRDIATSGEKAALDLGFEQEKRFADISKQAAAMLEHRTDQYAEQTGLSDMAASERDYLRVVVADTFEPRWQNKAACKGPAGVLFYPPTYSERKDDKLEREGRAKAICELCPVRRECLESALIIKEGNGIWGGFNEKERQGLQAAYNRAPGLFNLSLE